MVKRIAITVPTDESGAADVKSTEQVKGRIAEIQYVPDGSAAYDNTVDATITGDVTGKTILVKANIAAAFQVVPKQPTVLNADASAALYAAAGTAVLDDIFVDDERIRIVLAQGGASKTGVFYITMA